MPALTKRYIEIAHQITTNQGRVGKNVNVGEIKAEAGQGQALKEKRDTFLNKAVVAPVDQFDEIYDSGMEDYLRFRWSSDYRRAHSGLGSRLRR